MTSSYPKNPDRLETALNDAGERVTSAAETARQQGKAALRATEDAVRDARHKAADLADDARDLAAEVKGAAADTVDAAQSRIGDMAHKARRTASEAKDAMVDSAGATFSALRDGAVQKADDARETLSDVGDRLAETLNRASEQDRGDALKSRLFSSMANGLTSASDVLRQRSVTDLSHDLRAVARRHPGAFMAAAAVAGFAAARFLRSSGARADHRQTMMQRDPDDSQKGYRS